MVFVLWGCCIWFVATVIFRFGGQYLLNPQAPLWIGLSFVLVVPLIAAITYPLYTWRKLNSSERLRAAVFIALPGMVLDGVSLSFFRSVFPNLTLEASSYFSSWLLWAYSLILITGFVPGSRGPLSRT